MELKIVIDGLDTALAEHKALLNGLKNSAVLRHEILVEKLDTLLTESSETKDGVSDLNFKLDAVHTMLNHLADTQAAHGVQLNSIMSAIQALGTPQEPAEELPLVGMNLAGLGNNPWCQPGQLGTHYRSILDRLGQDYLALHVGHLNGQPWLARLPFSLERLFTLEEGGGFYTNQVYLDQIIDVIHAINGYNGKVILDAHNYCRWDLPWTSQLEANGHQVRSSTVNGVTFKTCWVPIGHADNPVSYSVLCDMYIELAFLFKGRPGYFGFGMMNEPFGSVEAGWFANVQNLINAYRSEDMNAWLTVSGGAYSSAEMWRQVSDQLKTLVDPADKLLFEAHQYPDANGGGGGSWQSPSTPVDPVARVNDWVDWVNWLKENNLRGYAGEFGGPGTTEGMQEYFTGLYNLFEENRIPCTQWLAGPGDSDNYANGMDTSAGGVLALKANAVVNHSRLGRTCTAYGPRV